MAQPNFPAVGHEVTGGDWAVIYGPLGLMAAVFLALLVMLWRSSRAEARAFRAELKERDEQLTAAREAFLAELERARATFYDELKERDEQWRQEIRALAHEQAETTRSVTDKYHDHAVAMRAVMDATGRRIGRRGE